MPRARRGRRVDARERRAVRCDQGVGAVATDAQHRRALDDRDAARSPGSCVLTTALATHGSASTRLWIAAPLIVKMLSSGTSAAATTAPVVSRWVADHGHLPHLEGRERQRQPEEGHLHRECRDGDEASLPGRAPPRPTEAAAGPDRGGRGGACAATR